MSSCHLWLLLPLRLPSIPPLNTPPLCHCPTAGLPVSEPPHEAALVLAGLALNAAAFCAAALCLHRLSLRVLADAGHRGTRGNAAAASDPGSVRSMANLSVLLFCFNPASVFYSAAYSESLFVAATWVGLLLLYALGYVACYTGEPPRDNDARMQCFAKRPLYPPLVRLPD